MFISVFPVKRLFEQLSDFWTVVRKVGPDMDFNTLFPLLHLAWKSWPRPLVPALVNGIPERERLSFCKTRNWKSCSDA
jgi:hypothetical protein